MGLEIRDDDMNVRTVRLAALVGRPAEKLRDLTTCGRDDRRRI